MTTLFGNPIHECRFVPEKSVIYRFPIDQKICPFCGEVINMGVPPQPTITELVIESYNTAKKHGFWDGEQSNIPTKLALIHSEVSEVLEEYRKIDYSLDKIGEELADVCIRVFDLAGHLGINLEYLINWKVELNKRRSFRHGKRL